MKDPVLVELGNHDEDIGISTGDAQSIKLSILHAVREGFVETGDCDVLAADLISAFKAIDSEVFARESMMSGLTGMKK